MTRALRPTPPRVVDVQKWYRPEGMTEIGSKNNEGVLRDSEKSSGI